MQCFGPVWPSSGILCTKHETLHKIMSRVHSKIDLTVRLQILSYNVTTQSLRYWFIVPGTCTEETWSWATFLAHIIRECLQMNSQINLCQLHHNYICICNVCTECPASYVWRRYYKTLHRVMKVVCTQRLIWLFISEYSRIT